jgi:hypothetical protein
VGVFGMNKLCSLFLFPSRYRVASAGLGYARSRIQFVLSTKAALQGSLVSDMVDIVKG